ncbi:hypothetical protein, partial [Thiolapillus sp.]|uniref:hypothetical protein n=1 Tax=Thiolapillus sp. TaxID=2017437 RepID=UPI0025D9FF61
LKPCWISWKEQKKHFDGAEKSIISSKNSKITILLHDNNNNVIVRYGCYRGACGAVGCKIEILPVRGDRL